MNDKTSDIPDMTDAKTYDAPKLDQIPKEKQCQVCETREATRITASKTRVCEKCLAEISAPLRLDPQPSRNDLCICGSGKKYKKCCWLKFGGC